MEKRHVFFGVVFVAVFGVGMLNVISDGRLSHAIQSQFPWHTGDSSTTPQIEVEDLKLAQGETGETVALVRNAEKVSYRDYSMSGVEENSPQLEAELFPYPSTVQESYPPNWLYDHPEQLIEVRMKFNISEETDPGNYTYGVEAWNGEGNSVTENLTVQVLDSSLD